MENVLPGVATPYMKHLEVMAFRVLGERIHALESIRSYWGGMIDADASTFFEAFKEKEELSDISKFYNRRFGRSLCKRFYTVLVSPFARSHLILSGDSCRPCLGSRTVRSAP